MGMFEKHSYKSWSSLKKQMNELLCPELKGKISYFYTTYHKVHNAYGRASISYNNNELVCFSWDKKLSQVQDIKEQYSKMDYVPSMIRGDTYKDCIKALNLAQENASKEKWMPDCILCEGDFIHSISLYLNTDITLSLHSDNYLLRVFAYMDRRVGKRTLLKIQNEVKELPEWVNQFYFIRCEAENLIQQPDTNL